MLPKGTLEHAKRIRKALVRGRVRANARNLATDQHLQHPLGLDGVCGLASFMLCLAIGDTELQFLKGTDYHVWNEFPFPCSKKTMIVDITATQFGGDFITTDGVYLGTRPQSFHRLAYGREPRFRYGPKMLRTMIRDEWYTELREGATLGEIRRWRAACRTYTDLAASRSTAPTARRATKG